MLSIAYAYLAGKKQNGECNQWRAFRSIPIQFLIPLRDTGSGGELLRQFSAERTSITAAKVGATTQWTGH
jgi:hypothetical protein